MNPEETLQMPRALSTIASEIDFVYYAIYWISVVFFVAITVVMLWFVWKYHRSRNAKSTPTGHHFKLEIFWTFTPLILLIWLFYIGFDGYMKGVVAPKDSVEIYVKGRQWQWNFKHMPRGSSEDHQLVVPANKPVKLIMSSMDVLHSFFVPEFRVKRDVVPGLYTTLWFETGNTTRYEENGQEKMCDIAAKLDTGEDSCGQDEDGNRLHCMAEYRKVPERDPKTGDIVAKPARVGVCHRPIQAYCTEYCGSTNQPPDNVELNHYYNHSSMYAKVVVLELDEYHQYVQNLFEYAAQPPPECMGEDNPDACWGGKLYAANCVACHKVDGSQGSAPDFVGLWGRTEQLSDGSSITVSGVDGENYLRQSILEPQAKIVAGYAGVNMPSFAGAFADPELEAVLAYLKSLGSGDDGAAPNDAEPDETSEGEAASETDQDAPAPTEEGDDSQTSGEPQ